MTHSGQHDETEVSPLDDSTDTSSTNGANGATPSALNAEEWTRARQLVAHGRDLESIVRLTIPNAGRSRLAATIAIVNDMLPDRDARKLTRADVAVLREAASADSAGRERLRSLADTLESYLPPI